MQLPDLFIGLPPELPVLLALTQRQMAHQNQIIAWLEAGGQDDQLYGLAKAHGLLPLLYRGLINFREKSASLLELTARLEREFTESSVVSEFIYPGQLARALRELGKAGVETVVLKGYAWGQMLYQQPALRPYGDFDLLVRESQLEIVEQILTTMGYWPDESQFSREWYRSDHHHLAPFVHQHYLPIEIHWGLVTPSSTINIPIETVWQQARWLDIQGVATYILSPEHALIYLCIHAVGTHLFEMGLRGLCDVQELIMVHGGTLNWNVVFEISHQWRCERHVYLMLQLVTVASGISLPQTVLHRLHEQEIAPAFLEYCLANMLATAITGLPQSSGLAQVWQEKRPLRRLSLAARKLLPSRSTVANHYHLQTDDPKLWFYYPRWQLLFLRRHLRTSWQLLQAQQETLEEVRRESIRRQLVSWLEA